jgi:aminocarboxymuconate-semialdehyde decarboxylase
MLTDARGSLQSSPGASGAARPGGPPAVDVHAHVVPRAFVEALRRHGPDHGVEVLGDGGAVRISIGGRLTPPLDPLLLDVESRLATMDRQGIGCQVVSPWMELMPWPLAAGDALWLARAHNDALAELAASSGGRFDALAMVPLHTADGAAAELGRALGSLRMAGAEIATSVGGADLAAAELAPFRQLAARRRALLLLHPFRPLGGDRCGVHRLGDVVGNPAESTLAVGRIVLGGVLRELPGLTLCVVHGGGFLPYQAGRMEALADAGAPWPPGWVGEDLSKLYFDSLTHSQRSLRWLVEFAGAERVVLGGDYPFPTGSADPAAAVRGCPGLSAAEREAVLYATARRLLAAVRR